MRMIMQVRHMRGRVVRVEVVIMSESVVRRDGRIKMLGLNERQE